MGSWVYIYYFYVAHVSISSLLHFVSPSKPGRVTVNSTTKTAQSLHYCRPTPNLQSPIPNSKLPIRPKIHRPSLRPLHYPANRNNSPASRGKDARGSLIPETSWSCGNNAEVTAEAHFWAPSSVNGRYFFQSSILGIPLKMPMKRTRKRVGLRKIRGWVYQRSEDTESRCYKCHQLLRWWGKRLGLTAGRWVSFQNLFSTLHPPLPFQPIPMPYRAALARSSAPGIYG